MRKAEKVEKIQRILADRYPETPVPLDHKDPYTLLVAVMLSAQTTDKKVNEVKDCYNKAIQEACLKHRERRKYLRSAMRELVLLCADQPGLLGPKALFIFMGMSFCRDEVIS